MKIIIVFTLVILITIGTLYSDGNVERQISILDNSFNTVELLTVNNYPSDSINTTKNDSILLHDRKKPGECFYLALDTVALPGVQVGFGGIKYDSTSTKESIFVIHANTMLMVSSLGISGKINTFKTPDRIGFYTSYNIGVDYVFTTGVGPGGGNVTINEYLLPNFSFGIGYSFLVGKNSFFRLSGDLGIKAIIASVTLSSVF